MSGNAYYYYPRESSDYPVNQNQSWSPWSVEQQQYNRNNPQYNHEYHASATHQVSPNAQSHLINRNQNFYNGTNRHYQHQQRRYAVPAIFPNPVSSNWPQRGSYKRPRPDSSMDMSETKSKANRKKKKPLSQNIPSKKDWTMEDAEKALAVEKEFNRGFKNHSLIIKFPDLELNRDIVSKFHTAIENVHFQQPSTPRFCFVTLQESADAESVIQALNKIQFGDGYLTAEYKKDREEDQNIGPEDIDPMTLYVGNLAQEITKEDMVKTYPKQRRIDIGYAKKMKYTRYAFVSFKTVEDSIEAFKKTHSTQMYSKSIIVRFRRLHGTVGMPGETKQQNPSKKSDNPPSSNNATENTTAVPAVSANSEPSTSSDLSNNLDLSLVKQEAESSDNEYDETDYVSPYLAGTFDFRTHRPIVKTEIKEECDEEKDELLTVFSPIETQTPIYPPVDNNEVKPRIKQEDINIKKDVNSSGDDDDDDDDEEDTDNNINFANILNRLEDHSKQISSLQQKFTP